MRTLVVSLSLGALLAPFPCRSGSTQPIPFNHRIHTVTSGLECETCHEGSD